LGSFLDEDLKRILKDKDFARGQQHCLQLVLSIDLTVL